MNKIESTKDLDGESEKALAAAVVASDVWLDFCFPYHAGSRIHDAAMQAHRCRYGLLALVRTRRGLPEEAPALCDRALALSPREPLRAVWYLALAWSALARKDYAAGLDAAQRGMAANPGLPTNYAAGAAAAQALGEKDLAARWVQRLREHSVFRSVPAFHRRMPVATSPAHRRQMQEAAHLLAQAGLPEVE